jgi:hypothetical protein
VRTLLRSARTVSDVTPGSVLVIGTHAGRWLGRVLAWEFEVGADDPIVTMDLLPVSSEAVQRALDRNRPTRGIAPPILRNVDGLPREPHSSSTGRGNWRRPGLVAPGILGHKLVTNALRSKGTQPPEVGQPVAGNRL